jgi:hypothetical protein
MLRLAVIAGMIALGGCAELDRAVYEQGAYNSQRCSGYGLWPGSNAYSSCMTQGGNYRPPSTFAPSAFGMPPDQRDMSCKVSTKSSTTGDAFNSTIKSSSSYYCVN